MDKQLIKTLSEIKSSCKTSNQRKAFNELVRSFNKDKKLKELENNIKNCEQIYRENCEQLQEASTLNDELAKIKAQKRCDIALIDCEIARKKLERYESGNNKSKVGILTNEINKLEKKRNNLI